MKKTVIAMLLVVSAAFALCGCKSWAPASNETGSCSSDRHWVAPHQDEDGNWVEGYCEWNDGKAG